MSNAKEIRGKIKSVKNTRKITKAMEMVAASKMRRAQERMLAGRPYSEKIRSVIGHLAQAHSELKHPFMQERPLKRAGLILVSTDRGLCGSLNANAFKATIQQLRDYDQKKIPVDLAVYGQKGIAFFKRYGGNVVAQAGHLGDKPQLADTIGVLKNMLDAYLAGQIDRLLLVRSRFINSISQKPEVLQLLPLPSAEDEKLSHYWDYLYEPDPESVIDALLKRYLESLVYQAVVENVAAEMASRMVAMKNASDNAGTLIRELTLIYNKARQAAITQEISEIVGGAAALE